MQSTINNQRGTLLLWSLVAIALAVFICWVSAHLLLGSLAYGITAAELRAHGSGSDDRINAHSFTANVFLVCAIALQLLAAAATRFLVRSLLPALSALTQNALAIAFPVVITGLVTYFAIRSGGALVSVTIERLLKSLGT